MGEARRRKLLNYGITVDGTTVELTGDGPSKWKTEEVALAIETVAAKVGKLFYRNSKPYVRPVPKAGK